MAEEQSGAPSPGLSKEQKIGFVFLLVFGFVGLILGVLQIRNTMFEPFKLTSKIPSTVKDSINDVNNLRYRDTDHDGLSDYDETYEYGTSPYLYDTYGYGKSDKEVVDKGLPLCANAGKNCTDLSTAAAVATTSTSSTAPVAEFTISDLNALMTDPKKIRELLLKNGVGKDVLDKMSDAELLQLVNQIMTSSTITSTSSTN